MTAKPWAALYILCSGVLMIVLDATIVNVALPSIQNDLGFTTSSLAWVVNSYLIAFGGLLLLAGRLGDLVGRRTVFLAGLAVFTLASLACGLAETREVLVLARFVQGLGGAMTSAVVLGVIVTMFTEPKDQAKAIGVYAFVASAGAAVGLVAGGVLTQVLNWHWIFFVNVPIGLATAVAALRLVPADKGIGFGKGADVIGAVLVTATLVLAVFTIVDPAATDGWTSGTTLGCGAATVALLVAFIVRERTAASPLMQLGIFRSRTITGSNVVQVLATAGMFGMFFMGALYVQRVLHYDSLQTGLAFLPGAVFMGVLSVQFSEKLITKFGAQRCVVAGMTLIAAALLLFTQASAHGHYITAVFPAMTLMGLGGGTAFPALMGLAMTGAKPEEAGLASGLINTSAQVGGALGLAVLATLAASQTADATAAGKATTDALLSGYRLAFTVGAGCLVACIVIAATVLRVPSQASVGSDAASSEGEAVSVDDDAATTASANMTAV